MSENKVQFGLKNVHYAVMTGDGTYSAPVAVPGAVNLSLEAEGDQTKFYADNILYFVANSNAGYSGELEVARFPDQMLQDIWGYTLGSTSKVLVENANTEPKTFALLYQINGDQNDDYFVLYSCAATRPGIGSSTKEESTEPQTQSCSITCAPLSSGVTFARTTKDTPKATKDTWFTNVFTEA